MKIVTIDFETYWSPTHSLTKMNPIAYVMHPETELISVAVKQGKAETKCAFGEAAIRELLGEIDWSDVMVVGHNMAEFDAMILKWRLGITPKAWACTLAMARPHFAKTIGLSLAKLVEYFNLGVKDNSALLATKGKKLKDFTPDELWRMADYNKADTDQCYGLFKILHGMTRTRELATIDQTIRMLVEPKFVTDTALLENTLTAEQFRKRKQLESIAEMIGAHLGPGEDPAEAVKIQLASAPKFAALLTQLGVEVPMKLSPAALKKGEEKLVPALAKTDLGFIALQTHPDPVVAAAAMARLGVKSTMLESRIESFLEVSRYCGGKMPIALRYAGADTTGRWSGIFSLNQQNLPRVGPKPALTDALRGCLTAPPGHKVIVADLSGIELRMNHFFCQTDAMELFVADPAKADLYKDFAAKLFGVPVEDVTKAQRHIGKLAHLGLGYGSGISTFQKIAKLMGGIDLPMDECESTVTTWRRTYEQIPTMWKRLSAALPAIQQGARFDLDSWGLCYTTSGGIVLPSGRQINYPELRKVQDDKTGKSSWKYGLGRHEVFIHGAKVLENIIQALSRDVLADNMMEFERRTGVQVSHTVHDEIIAIVPEYKAQQTLDTLQEIMRTPPKWFPQLVVWSEGDIGDRYSEAK